jgi:Thrombospondin type 3 repeat
MKNNLTTKRILGLAIIALMTVIVGCSGSDEPPHIYPLFDTDADGFYDYEDNCPSIANEDQADEDDDNIGDACDDDTDGDGVADGDDPAPNDPKITFADVFLLPSSNLSSITGIDLVQISSGRGLETVMVERRPLITMPQQAPESGRLMIDMPAFELFGSHRSLGLSLTYKDESRFADAVVVIRDILDDTAQLWLADGIPAQLYTQQQGAGPAHLRTLLKDVTLSDERLFASYADNLGEFNILQNNGNGIVANVGRFGHKAKIAGHYVVFHVTSIACMPAGGGDEVCAGSDIFEVENLTDNRKVAEFTLSNSNSGVPSKVIFSEESNVIFFIHSSGQVMHVDIAAGTTKKLDASCDKITLQGSALLCSTGHVQQSDCCANWVDDDTFLFDLAGNRIGSMPPYSQLVGNGACAARIESPHTLKRIAIATRAETVVSHFSTHASISSIQEGSIAVIEGDTLHVYNDFCSSNASVEISTSIEGSPSILTPRSSTNSAGVKRFYVQSWTNDSEIMEQGNSLMIAAPDGTSKMITTDALTAKEMGRLKLTNWRFGLPSAPIAIELPDESLQAFDLDSDNDGIEDDTDNCPNIANHVRRISPQSQGSILGNSN